MKRALRMIVLLIAATVVAAHTKVHAVLILVVALSFDEFAVGDVLVLWVASLFVDHAGVLPLAISFLPLVSTYVLSHFLKTQFYVYTFVSRLAWSVSAVLFYYLVWVLILVVRGGDAYYLWRALLYDFPTIVLEGSVAAIISPLLHYLLTVTWSDLTKPRGIVVP